MFLFNVRCFFSWLRSVKWLTEPFWNPPPGCGRCRDIPYHKLIWSDLFSLAKEQHASGKSKYSDHCQFWNTKNSSKHTHSTNYYIPSLLSDSMIHSWNPWSTAFSSYSNDLCILCIFYHCVFIFSILFYHFCTFLLFLQFVKHFL